MLPSSLWRNDVIYVLAAIIKIWRMKMLPNKKMEYDKVYQVFDTLHYVFGVADNEEIDDRCQALWILFLSSVGWTQDEFWAEWDLHEETCPECNDKIPSTDDKKTQN